MMGIFWYLFIQTVDEKSELKFVELCLWKKLNINGNVKSIQRERVEID